MSETAERSYYLVESMYFEKLLRTHFMLTDEPRCKFIQDLRF